MMPLILEMDNKSIEQIDVLLLFCEYISSVGKHIEANV